jgi:hypothetical protein
MTVRSRYRRVGAWLCVLAALALSATVLASCGGTGSTGNSSSTTTKIPPGASEQTETTESTTPTSSQAGTSGTAGTASESESETTQTAAQTPNNSADLVGGRFTVVSATRPDSNKSVVSSGGREVKGDYLEVEFTILDASASDLVDLSEYSFRLTSPGIAADTYADYYGETGTYGAYVDDDEISAALLDYSSLQAVSYLLKAGEEVDKVFVFFDLNPENVARNTAVTKDNTTLIIHKVSGTDYGDEVTIPLAGYPDA